MFLVYEKDFSIYNYITLLHKKHFRKDKNMNVGYVRLSRDDDKRNYVSIENQKLIINQYASDHGLVIDRWY